MGMYTECQAELIRALREAGCEREPFLTRKRMLQSGESRMSAVLCENDAVERATGKRFFKKDGKSLKRTKLYDRDITFTVVIGDYTQEKAEDTYEKFLCNLKKGIYVNENYISCTPSDASWMGEGDHILYAKSTIQAVIIFRGGLYQDTEMAALKDVDLIVEKGD